MAFKFDNLANLLSDEIAVTSAQISVVVLIRHMDNELCALGVSAERHCIHLQQVDLPIDL